MHFLVEVAASPQAGCILCDFHAWRKEASQQKHDAKPPPSEGFCLGQGRGCPVAGTRLRLNCIARQELLGARAGGSLLWPQKVGATSKTANCFKTAGAPRLKMWKPHHPAESCVPADGQTGARPWPGNAELGSPARQGAEARVLCASPAQTQQFSTCVQEEQHSDSHL